MSQSGVIHILQEDYGANSHLISYHDACVCVCVRQGKAKVQDVFHQVCDHVGLRETEYFALAQLIGNSKTLHTLELTSVQ